MDLNEIWAKSPRQGETRGESLAAHTKWVLKNLALLQQRAPSLSTLCGMPRFWIRATLAAALHDLGKCAAGFQQTLRNGPRFLFRHEVLSCAFLPWLFRGDPDNDLQWVAATILTHHKDIDFLNDYIGSPQRSLVKQLNAGFFQSGTSIFRHAILPAVENLQLPIPTEILQGANQPWTFQDTWERLQMVLEYVNKLYGVLEKLDANTPEALAARFLRGSLILADHSGSAHQAMRFLEAVSNVESITKTFSYLPPEGELFFHQREARSTTGNTILIAPTGSGKTESALFWVANSSHYSRGKPVIFYVLPYQASMNAMQKRFESSFGQGTVALQHSRALQWLYRRFLDKDYSPKFAAINAKNEGNLASLHVKPLRVLSPYQILRAAYQLKGHESIWTDAAGALFIIDEIHAYEANRLGMILATLRHITRDMGGQVLIMSATMPSVLQQLLSEVCFISKSIVADTLTFERFCRHEVRLLSGDLTDASTEQSIRAAYKQGQSVLVVANTVSRAQDLYDRLQDLGAELLHGRFHAKDRANKETELLQKLGVGTQRTERGALLIATQVVEVSLNVDFDVLFTDPAPLEALLQRFGRVNRKSQKERPEPKPVHVMRGIPEGCPVYQEDLVHAAIAQLEAWNGKLLAESQVQAMLNCIYAGEVGSVWSSEVKSAMTRFEETVLKVARPLTSEEEIKEKFEELFDGFEVLPISELDNYRSLKYDQPLLAPSLLVPITTGQYHKLKRSNLLFEEDDVIVANCPYTFERGLELQSVQIEDGT